jgi:hypothetical protein
MNKQTYLLFIVAILIFFVCLCSVSAFSIQKMDEKSVEYNNNKSIITISIVADNVVANYKMKNDLNNIEKIIVKVNGKIVNTIKKGKGWSKYKYYPMAILDRSTIIKGKVKGKNITILTYDKKNQIIKSKKSTVKSVYAETTKNIINSKHPKNARLTYAQAHKMAVEPKDKEIKKIIYLGYYFLEGDLYWSFKAVSQKGEELYFSVYDLIGSFEAG